MDSKTIMKYVKSIIQKTRFDYYKGKMGKICVIGGSECYTGAPYFSAISAMKMGCDIACIICPPSAAIPIKVYSPDLIVAPLLDPAPYYEKIEFFIDRYDSFVLGPGLGRDPSLLTAVSKIISKINSLNKPLVIDADGLWFASRCLSQIKSHENIILTPNHNEYEAFIKQISVESGKPFPSSLSQCLGGVRVIEKGSVDIIAHGTDIYHIKEVGSSRRCGGQGDILSGIIATFAYWSTFEIEGPNLELDRLTASCISACYLMKVLSKKTEEKKGKRFLASDIIENILSIHAFVDDYIV